MNFGANDRGARANSKLLHAPRDTLSLGFGIRQQEAPRTGRRSCSPMRGHTLGAHAVTEPRSPQAMTRSRSYDFGYSERTAPRTITCVQIPDKPLVNLDTYMTNKKNPPPPKKKEEPKPGERVKKPYNPPPLAYLEHMERKAKSNTGRGQAHVPPPYGVGNGDRDQQRLSTGKKYGTGTASSHMRTLRITDKVPTGDELAEARSPHASGRCTQATPKDLIRHPWNPPAQQSKVSCRSRSCPMPDGMFRDARVSQKPTYPHKTSSNIEASGGVMAGHAETHSARSPRPCQARHEQSYSVHDQQLPPGKSTLRGRSCDVGRSLSVGRSGPTDNLPVYTSRKRNPMSDQQVSGSATHQSLTWQGQPQGFSKRRTPHLQSTRVHNALTGVGNPMPVRGKKPLSHAITFSSRQITLPQTLPRERPGASKARGAMDPWGHTRLWG